jgi:alkylation response protein AidB-like acyl-CoA dehydrogenase
VHHADLCPLEPGFDFGPIVLALRLDLDADQQFFRETTARFLDEFAPPAEVRRLRDDPRGFEGDFWRRGAELGWTSLLVGENAGGGSISGQGVVDLGLVAHEFGMHAAPGPLLPCNLVAAAIARHDPAHELVAPLVSGEAIASWAFTEPAPNDGIEGGTCEVRVDGGDVVLAGIKAPVEAAASASHLLVTGGTGDGSSQVLVPVDAPGVTLTPMKSVDLTRRFSLVRFDGVRLPPSAVVGEQGSSQADVEWQLHHAFVFLAAEGVGAMQRAFDMTVEWAFDRYSFGRPLASYQALKHRFADMKTWLEASHAITDAAATAVAEGRPDAGKLASVAMAYVGQYGSDLLQECVQLHGGIGLTFEHDLHLVLRRHTLDRTLFGTPAEHRARVTSILERDAAA